MRTKIISDTLSDRPHTCDELMAITGATRGQVSATVKWFRRRGFKISYNRRTDVYSLDWSPPPGVCFHHVRREWVHRMPNGLLSHYACRDAAHAAWLLAKWMHDCPSAYAEVTL